MRGVAWRDVAAIYHWPKFKNARLHRENLQSASIIHKKRYEITHLCVPKAGILKEAAVRIV